ncbi:hypothetical protein [Nocardiopsis suaedae]|uniref:Pycsar effector protein domain-containing protein n=1 Tax=Nocardiopsis suaedae TaxID=3018444 RepID=A0ABT4TIL2_9ACTN|nr:hypothetical protein [Nocardiopsis suaedae]MDA2804550.1 hypothetical protein [Nocardiopsis suaedae]
MSEIELSEAIEEVRTEVGRIDTKASLLMGLAGAGAGIAASGDLLTGDEPGVWLVRAGAAALAGATLAALKAVRPRLARAPFMRNRSVAAPRLALDLESPQERYQALCTVAAAKYKAVRCAVDLIIFAVLTIAAGTVWQHLT